MRKTVRGRGNGNDRTQNDSRESKWALRGGWNEKDCAGRRKFVVLCFIVFLCASPSSELVVFDPG
jgi:hypothetical protein